MSSRLIEQRRYGGVAPIFVDIRVLARDRSQVAEACQELLILLCRFRYGEIKFGLKPCRH